MTALLTRNGTEYTGPISRTTTGRAFYTTPRKCGRCGGAGRSDKWAFTGYTCFDCGGERYKGTETVNLYTVDQLAGLNARKAKADAKRHAAAAARNAEHQARVAAMHDAFYAEHAALIARSAPHMDNEFIGSVMTRALADCLITEKQAAAVLGAVDRIETQAKVRAASTFVGKPGERLEIAVTVERVVSFEQPAFNAPWTTTVVNIVTMRDAAGNAIVSKGRFYADKGASITIRGTIKDHSTYNEERQTIVQRVKVAA